IAPIVTFKTFDEVVERANSLPYGLAAYAFTSSNATAAAIGDAIASGMVGVNSVAVSTPETPFGGGKESGHGSEGGIEGLGAYLNTKFFAEGEALPFRLPPVWAAPWVCSLPRLGGRGWGGGDFPRPQLLGAPPHPALRADLSPQAGRGGASRERSP